MNAAAPISIPACPDVLVYPDIRDNKRFYAFAAHPRAARDESGVPQISLMVYGKTSGGRFKASGAQLTATFDLAVTPAERQVIEQQVHGTVLYPDWIDSQVAVDVTDGVTAHGSASLAGTNECVVSAMLTGSQADALRQAWTDNSRAIKVQYVVGVRASTQAVASSATTETYATANSTRSYASQVDMSNTQTGRVQMTLEGNIELGTLDLANRIQTISL